MAMTVLRRRVARLAAAGLLASVALVPLAAPTLAADPVLPRPTASARFLSHIAFAGTATLSGPVRRLEIVLDIEGFQRSVVADVVPRGTSGRVDLEYVMETPGGGLVPNTDVTARFRATLDDGTLIDGPSTTVHYEDTRYDWRVLRGDLVTVHWTDGPAAFGRRALRIGEDAVRDVGDLLGVTESDPIDFFVYADRAAFYDVLGAAARENVGGTAHPEVRTLFATIGPDAIDDPWVGVVVPHELAHLVFDTATRNPYHDPPRWLNEGLAVYLAEGYGSGDRNSVEDAVAARRLMPLGALIGQFPTTEAQFRLAYAESVSAVAFLVDRYGEDSMVRLVRSYADGVTDDEAFRAALGIDVAGFEAAWLDDLGAPAPRPYGPIDAPPGPVPSDWHGEGSVPGDIPDDAVSTGPTSTPTTGTPGVPGASDDGGATGVLAVLVVFGLALGGIGVWLARRHRPGAPDPAAEIALRGVSTAAPTSPSIADQPDPAALEASSEAEAQERAP